jgi:hypothetical protein
MYNKIMLKTFKRLNDLVSRIPVLITLAFVSILFFGAGCIIGARFGIAVCAALDCKTREELVGTTRTVGVGLLERGQCARQSAQRCVEQEEPEASEEFVPGSSTGPEVVLDSLDTSDWQVYKDGERGFQFVYPSDFLDADPLSEGVFFRKVALSDSTPEADPTFDLKVGAMSLDDVRDYRLRGPGPGNDSSVFKPGEFSKDTGIYAWHGFFGDPPYGGYSVYYEVADGSGIFIRTIIEHSDLPAYGGDYYFYRVAKEIFNSFELVVEE